MYRPAKRKGNKPKAKSKPKGGKKANETAQLPIKTNAQILLEAREAQPSTGQQASTAPVYHIASAQIFQFAHPPPGHHTAQAPTPINPDGFISSPAIDGQWLGHIQSTSPERQPKYINNQYQNSSIRVQEPVLNQHARNQQTRTKHDILSENLDRILTSIDGETFAENEGQLGIPFTLTELKSIDSNSYHRSRHRHCSAWRRLAFPETQHIASCQQWHHESHH